MQRPFIHPYAYSVLILLFTSFTVAVIILLLSLFCCYCCYKIVATDNLCRARLSPGAGELTNHLLRLTFIFWLPLCLINKLGFTSRKDYCHPLYLWVISGHSGTTGKNPFCYCFPLFHLAIDVQYAWCCTYGTGGN